MISRMIETLETNKDQILACHTWERVRCIARDERLTESPRTDLAKDERFRVLLDHAFAWLHNIEE